MNKSLEREFDIFTGVIPEKEEVSEVFRADAKSRLTKFAQITSGKREWKWLEQLERLHAQRTAQASA